MDSRWDSTCAAFFEKHTRGHRVRWDHRHPLQGARGDMRNEIHGGCSESHACVPSSEGASRPTVEDIMLDAEGQRQVTEPRLAQGERIVRGDTGRGTWRQPCHNRDGGASHPDPSFQDAVAGGWDSERVHGKGECHTEDGQRRSKGSFLNLSQICACLGQQSLEGERIRMCKGTRTLPCFSSHEDSLESRGMVFNPSRTGPLSIGAFLSRLNRGREGSGHGRKDVSDGIPATEAEQVHGRQRHSRRRHGEELFRRDRELSCGALMDAILPVWRECAFPYWMRTMPPCV